MYVSELCDAVTSGRYAQPLKAASHQPSDEVMDQKITELMKRKNEYLDPIKWVLEEKAIYIRGFNLAR